MKSTQLLSVVLSLIMMFGVSAGSAFAQTEYVEDTSMQDEIENIEAEMEAEMDEIEAEIEEMEAEMDDKVEDVVDDEIDKGLDDDVDLARDGTHYNLDERLTHFCDMSDEDKRQFFEDHPRLTPFTDRLLNFCDLSDYSRDSKLKDFIRLHITDEDREKVKEYVKDYDRADAHDVDIDKDFREKLTSWCEMSEDEKSATAEEHGKTEDMIAKADRYCTLDESGRADFIAEHLDAFRSHMKDSMMDKANDKHHKMDYDRLCALAESDRAAEIDDSEKLDKLSKWCEMTPEERDEYKKEYHGEMKEKVHDKVMDKVHDEKYEMKLSDKSDRLKAMIMTKYDISDERQDEIKAKYMEKYGDLTDAKKSDLKMKFKDHMNLMKHQISDEHKSDIHDRLAEMKAFKAELREKASDMTDEEKQELRSKFIEKAKDMQLAWISPRTQITAGIDAGEVECREGFNLVMKASNGTPMCLKADTALKMIDRGLVVPAN